MRLLLTRQPAQAGGLEVGLAGARVGGEPLEVGFLPLVDFVRPEDEGPLRRMSAALRDPGSAGVLVVTSPMTVRALRRLGDGGLAPAVRAVATGPGTARALAAAVPGLRVWTPPADRSARGILAGMTGPAAAPEVVAGLWPPAPGGPAPVAWLPQSDRARPELAEGLRAAGWEVRAAVAYRTVPYPARPSWRRVLAGEDAADATVVAPGGLAGQPPGTAVLLTSSSAAEEFVAHGLAPLAGGRVRLLAIGEPTRATCERLGLPLAATCATPDASGVAAALAPPQSPDRPPTAGRP